MEKRNVFLGSIVLTLATSAVPFATVAEAAVAKHHYVRVTTAHNGHTQTANRGHRPRYVWVDAGWTGENSTDNSNWMDSYYNGYGSYRGYAGDFCGTIAWTLGICSPHGL
ncbi:hypothetical protein [Mesorhizobium sp. Cs1299R1N3]|uniref:hypothetical protein n=1 Tax=Mesorhizobium sp. Cs1299R1N3 TaxID=3015173 RepID=UPI00301DEA03